MRKAFFVLAIAVLIFAGCTRPKPKVPTPTPQLATPAKVSEVQPSPTKPATPKVEATPSAPQPTEAATAQAATPTPPPATPQPVATPPGGECIEYTVRWGDTLESIAARFGTTVEAIVQANKLADKDFIYAGQKLKIPGKAQAVPVQPGATSEYVVRPGDTLYSIAARFNTTVEAIMAVNRIINPNFIYVGQRLIIPAGQGAGASITQPRTHIVQPGETLTSIALRYGVTVEEIVRANNLPNPNFIYVGQKLIIPVK